MSLDGNRLAVGAPYNYGNPAVSPVDEGAVYLFSFADSIFSSPTLEATIGKGYTGGKNFDVTTLMPGDDFGSGVSLNENRLAVGAPGAASGGRFIYSRFQTVSSMVQPWRRPSERGSLAAKTWI